MTAISPFLDGASVSDERSYINNSPQYVQVLSSNFQSIKSDFEEIKKTTSALKFQVDTLLNKQELPANPLPVQSPDNTACPVPSQNSIVHPHICFSNVTQSPTDVNQIPSRFPPSRSGNK